MKKKINTYIRLDFPHIILRFGGNSDELLALLSSPSRTMP